MFYFRVYLYVCYGPVIIELEMGCWFIQNYYNFMNKWERVVKFRISELYMSCTKTNKYYIFHRRLGSRSHSIICGIRCLDDGLLFAVLDRIVR